jgi:hypothetical protein
MPGQEQVKSLATGLRQGFFRQHRPKAVVRDFAYSPGMALEVAE